MSLAVVLSIIFSLVFFIISIRSFKRMEFNVRVISRIAVVAALGIVLYMIKLVPFPQGGGFSLLSPVPIILLAILYGMDEALVCAVIVALVKIIIEPPYFPMQIPLDYLGSMVAISIAPMFGVDKKLNLVLGTTIALLISLFFNVLSGVVFFGEFAPEGMNLWKYSFIYNFSGSGVEALLSVILIGILPMGHLKTIVVGK